MIFRGIVVIGLMLMLWEFGLLNFAFGVDVESNRVAIVVNKYLKGEIENSLNIYLQDLRNEGYEPVLREWDLENEPEPQRLKSYLKGLYLGKLGLQGAVLIGDLPIPIVKGEANMREEEIVPNTNGYICERYYMDLVGKEWTDMDGDFKFEEPDYKSYWESLWNVLGYGTEEVLEQEIEKAVNNEDLYAVPEIWVSRIITSTLTGLFKKSEGELVNGYLEKNHGYRTGQLVFKKQTLFYPSLDSADTAFKGVDDVRLLLSNIYELKEPISSPRRLEEFFGPLKNETYEIFYWGRHSGRTEIDVGLEVLTSDILANEPVNVSTAFVIPVSCWLGHYIEPGYFGGSYIFNPRYYTFGMTTATLPVYDMQFTKIVYELMEGRNLGLAFKKAIETPDGLPLEVPFILSSSYSRYIVGDGTLRLQVFNGARALDWLLRTAIKKGDYKKVNKLILQGANLRSEDEEGNTFLHLAVNEKAKEIIIRILIEYGVDIRVKNKFGNTAWDIARENGKDEEMFEIVVRSGTAEQVKYLIKNGADIYRRNEEVLGLLSGVVREEEEF